MWCDGKLHILYLYRKRHRKKRIIYRDWGLCTVFLCEKGIDEYYMSINIIYKFSHKNMWKVLYYIFILNAEIGFSCFVIYKNIFFLQKIFFSIFIYDIILTQKKYTPNLCEYMWKIYLMEIIEWAHWLEHIFYMEMWQFLNLNWSHVSHWFGFRFDKFVSRLTIVSFSKFNFTFLFLKRNIWKSL